MKISLIYPKTGVHTDNKNWMYYLGKELSKKCKVFDNVCPEGMDFILGMSISRIDSIKGAHHTNPNTPLILYNWDMHPLLQPEVGKWDEIGWDTLLNEATDVWTQTHYHAQLAEELSGVRHYVMPMGALDFEMEGIEPEDKGYAFMASRRVPYKGFELYESACEEIGMPYKSRHPNFDDREEFLKDLAGCKVVVIASEEEANTPMSGYEGAFLGKPLLLRDIPAFREEWEEDAIYFKDKEDLKDKLKDIDMNMGKKAKKRSETYTLEAFANRIYNRLCELSS